MGFLCIWTNMRVKRAEMDCLFGSEGEGSNEGGIRQGLVELVC